MEHTAYETHDRASRGYIPLRALLCTVATLGYLFAPSCEVVRMFIPAHIPITNTRLKLLCDGFQVGEAFDEARWRRRQRWLLFDPEESLVMPTPHYIRDNGAGEFVTRPGHVTHTQMKRTFVIAWSLCSVDTEHGVITKVKASRHAP